MVREGERMPWMGYHGYRDIGQIIKGIRDTFVKTQVFREIVIQSFLNLGEFGGMCQFLFRDMGYFFNI